MRRQTFRNRVHNGIDIEIYNLLPHTITWGDVEKVLVGLRQECGVQLCKFEFAVGVGTMIGGGRTYKTK